jgi:DmsE family decaheme c-type cytochrome
MKYRIAGWVAGLTLAAGLSTAALTATAADADKAGEKVPRKDLILRGDAQCTRCHDGSDEPNVPTIAITRHGVAGDSRTPTCTTCHGPSEKHLEGARGSKGRPAPDIVYKKGAYSATEDHVRADKCLTCHKGENRTNWHGSQHDVNGVACNDCHKTHQPVDKVRTKLTQTEVCFTCHKEQRAEAHKISAHPITIGKVVCSDCHNPHGSSGPKSLAKNTVNETCYTCHAEKRGPFLFEHRPAVEACTNCHMPHGSNITPLLISRPPFMCQQCHDGTHASATPAGPNVAGRQGGLTAAPSRNLIGRACMNCHSQIHGSNSPAGGYLQR